MVIVGAGPAGLVAGITLARAGIRCLVLNKRDRVGGHPRATVLSVRTMELVRSWGLGTQVLSGGNEVEWRMRSSTTLATVADGYSIDVGYPTVAQSAAISPIRPGCVPQDHLERVLLEHLTSLPAATVELGRTVDDVTPMGGGHRVRFHDLGRDDTPDGAGRDVQADYLIGADGAHGIVRQALDIGVTAREDLMHSLTVVLHAPLWDVVGEHRYGIYVTDEPTPAMFLPAGRDGRWIFGSSSDPGLDRRWEPTNDELLAQVRASAGVPDLPVRWGTRSRFSFSAALADRFRSGRAFLIGDAAHRVTPRGGTGMNTAIADGHDLGWKLSWVMHGWAPEALLDTYESERRPIAEHTVQRSIDPRGSRRDTATELPVDLGGRLPHMWVDTPAGPVSTVDMLGPGLTVFTADGRVEPARASGPPLRVRRVDRRTAVALAADRPGGLLVRPDGVPVEAGSAFAGREAA